eukprot:CAMPEP_0119388890 /NCGR_PEP_ID=MMETSP1334-20130426/106931_1 /TAXON_ID=127549 /ORGANISM="Calcidiscus leptoporus, Strain RCC1130" /LENGTH=88 /DNA_ID=CAMNT_0007411001 /DNA_START=302 /DNA_END=565 /DNA_ORIENTATION=+
MSSAKNACVGILHAFTHTEAQAASSRKRQRWTSTCCCAPSPTICEPTSSGLMSSREHFPMSHCAAHQVTHALSLADHCGNGLAKRMPN